MKIAHEDIVENDFLPIRFELINSAHPQQIPAHWHDYMEILYICSGHLSAVIDARHYDLEASDLILINPKAVHQTICYANTVYILMQVSRRMLDSMIPDFDQIQFQTFFSHSNAPAHMEQTRSFLLDMLQIYLQKEDGFQMLFSARMHEFFYSLYRYFRIPTTPLEQERYTREINRISRVLDYTREHYREPITLTDAAASLSISREYFCRLFKSYTGQTFLEYLYAIRAMNFHEELIHSRESITLLLEKHGITNYRVFMKAFQTLYGCTPQKERTRLREAHQS